MQHARAILVLVGALLLGALPFVRHVPGVEDAVKPLERPLGIRQGWRLYGTGPKIRRVFEVHADDEVLYRAADPEHRWRRASFTYRRVRPLVVKACMKGDANTRAFVAWTVRHAREARPDAERIVLRCTVGPWPAGDEEEKARFVATGPDWLARRKP